MTSTSAVPPAVLEEVVQIIADTTACGTRLAYESAAAVVAALDLPGRDRGTAAKALDEAADARNDSRLKAWLRSRAADLRKEAGQ